MKKIFIIITLCFFTSSIFSQDYKKQAELAAKDRNIPSAQVNDFIRNYILESKNAALKKTTNIFSLPPITTGICDDGGFETKDLANWGWTLAVNRKTGPAIVAFSTVPGTGNILNYATSYSYGASSTANLRWEIVSSGNDPLFPTLPKVHSGNKALKLGKEEEPGTLPNCGAESIIKTVNVNSSNSSISFWYAVVLQDPTTSTVTSHSADEAPAFGVKIHSLGPASYVSLLPNITGFSTTPINSVNNPFWTSAYISKYSTTEEIRMRPWTCASIDLSSYIGKTISIEFLINDCAHGGHFGYAYIDDICMGCAGSDMGDATIKGISRDCGPTAIVNGEYTLPHNASSTGTLNTIKAELYQGGLPTGHIITLTSANINTTTKTFNFPMSLFGTVPPGTYDIVVKASFTLSASTYTTISSLAGVISGTDNDWQSVCPQPTINCCQNKFSVVSPTAVPPSYPYNGGTYGIENFNVSVPNDIPITDIKVNVESFEILSDFKDCLKCDNKPATLGSLFGIRTIGSGANALTLTSQPYGTSGSVTTNSNELIWSNPYGVTLNTSDKLGIVYLLPADKELSCCANKAKLCIRISWRDINCGYCEVFNCSTIDLKNPKDLKAGFPLPDLLTLYLNSRGIFVTGHADGF